MAQIKTTTKKIVGVEQFLKRYGSKSTKKTYKWGLKNFFNTIYNDKSSLDEKITKYLSKDRDIKSDIENFFISLTGKPVYTVKQNLNVIKTFLVTNEIEFKQTFWKDIARRIKGKGAATYDEVPTKKKLKQIFTHMDAKGKALFLTMLSSGMRIGESLQIEMDDLDLDVEPTRIDVRKEYTKTGSRRTVFISSEATEALQEWFKIRKKSMLAQKNRMQNKKKRTKEEKKTAEKRVFSFGSDTARFIWNNALRKAQLLKHDKSTNRITIHPHVLRKFFRSKMPSAIPVDIVEVLMGHEGYLTGAYRQIPEEELAKKYLEAEYTVTIFKDIAEVIKLRKDIVERDNNMQIIIQSLTAKNITLENKVDQLNKDFQTALSHVNYLMAKDHEFDEQEKAEILKEQREKTKAMQKNMKY